MEAGPKGEIGEMGKHKRGGGRVWYTPGKLAVINPEFIIYLFSLVCLLVETVVRRGWGNRSLQPKNRRKDKPVKQETLIIHNKATHQIELWAEMSAAKTSTR